MWGDEYICPKCGIKVITGFGNPLMPWEPNYDVFVNEIDVEGKYY